MTDRTKLLPYPSGYVNNTHRHLILADQPHHILWIRKYENGDSLDRVTMKFTEYRDILYTSKIVWHTTLAIYHTNTSTGWQLSWFTRYTLPIFNCWEQNQSNSMYLNDSYASGNFSILEKLYYDQEWKKQCAQKINYKGSFLYWTRLNNTFVAINRDWSHHQRCWPSFQ